MASILYELLKQRVLKPIKDFYANEWRSEHGELVPVVSETYKQKVLSRDKNEFQACLRWYIEYEILTELDLETVENLRQARHYAVHKGVDLLFGGGRTFDDQLLVRGGDILERIGNFWGRIEIDIDPPGDGDVDYEGIRSADALMFEHIRTVAELMITAGLNLDGELAAEREAVVRDG